MSILTRYLLRTHAGPFIFALTVLTGLLFINTVARRMESLVGKGLGAWIFVEVFALSLPHIVALTLPMAVLVAVLYSFSQLTADNEVTAMKASGVNLIRLLMPLLLTAVLLALGMVYFNDRILPETNHKLKNLMSDIGRKSPTFTLKEQVINPIRPSQDLRTQYFLQPGSIDHTTGRMKDVVIYDLSLGNKTRTIYADSGRMAFNEGQTNLLLTLYDGYVDEIDTYEPQKFQHVLFRVQRQELKGIGDALERVNEGYRSDREMNLAMLQAQVDTARMELDSLRREAVRQNVQSVKRMIAGPIDLGDEDPRQRLAPSMGGAIVSDMASYAALNNRESGDDIARRAAIETRSPANQARNRELRANQNAVEWHKKFAIPAACIVFVLLGAPLAVRFPRGGAGMVIASSLGIFGIYYMSLIGGESLGDRGIVAPAVGPWAPNFVFLILALWGLSRIGRETSTARGGGWEDMWLTIRTFLSRPFRRAKPSGQKRAAPAGNTEGTGLPS
jgi:lipopolysaccharide export system permease protein